MTALDRAELLEGIDHDLELLGWMVGVFQRDSADLLRQLDAAMGQSDVEAAKTATHTLKGMLLSIAARPAQEKALELEELLRGEKLQAALSVVEQLSDQVRQAAEMLASVAIEEGAPLSEEPSDSQGPASPNAGTVQ